MLMSLSVRQQQVNLLNESLIRAKQRALQPPPELTLSQWSEEYMMLSPESSALPGKFRFDRAPFQREVMDAMTDDSIRKVVIMSASQILKTQVMLNFIGYIISNDPAPILIVQPTGKMAQSFSKDRVDAMLRDVPILKGRVKDKRERDSGNSILHKLFPAGALSIASAGSPSDLASRPIRYLLCDETDRYQPGEEGDPISLARARTTTFWNAKEVLVSSPTDDTISRIASEYQVSDRRIFAVPCNACGAFQQLLWEQVKWESDQPDTAYYECVHCQEHWDDQQKNYNISYGHWEKTNPEATTAGFHISNIYSSFKTLKDLVSNFLIAKKDQEQLRAFINTQLGQTWKTEATTVGEINFLNRLEAYDANTIPNTVGLITAGVDTQMDRLECEIVGWGVGDESWSIEYHVIHGNTNSPAPWVQLADLLDKIYTRKDGLTLKVNAMAIDAGGTAPQEVFAFAKKYAKHNVYAIKGVAGEGKLIFPKKYRRWKGGQRFYPVGVDSAKEKLYSQLALKEPGAGYCHYPTTYDEFYFRMLTAETYVIKYRRGHPYKVWSLKQGTRNEALDCRVYAMAARYSFNLDMTRRMEMLEKKAIDVIKSPIQEEDDLSPKIVPESLRPETLVKKRKPIRRTSGGMRDFMNSI